MAPASQLCAGAGPVAALALALAASPARAEPAPTPPSAPGETAQNPLPPGRFVMTPVPDGFLRLDTQSGQVSLCTINGGQAQCRASADERAALEAEIDRLAKENAALKAQKSSALTPSGPKTAEDEEDRRFDRALDRAERFMRGLMEIFRDLNGKPPPTSL